MMVLEVLEDILVKALKNCMNEISLDSFIRMDFKAHLLIAAAVLGQLRQELYV